MTEITATDAPYEGDDFYCDQVLNGRRTVHVVHETDRVLAFHHTRPYWPVHVVVIPKTHIPSLLELDEANQDLFIELLSVVRIVAARVVASHGAAAVLTNLGTYQDSQHLHWHVYHGPPRRSK